MKFQMVALFACVLVEATLAMTAEQTQMVQQMVGDCLASEGATEDDVAVLMRMEVPVTPAGMCLNACLMEKTGVIADGVFSVANSVMAGRQITDNNAEKMKVIEAVTAACATKLPAIASPDRCEYAKQVVECNTAGGQEHGYAKQRDLLSK